MTACRRREAAAYASATAGRAVIFAGVTVAISITGLAVIGIPFVTKLGIGGALGVLTAVLYATFLLPAAALADRPPHRPPARAGHEGERRLRGGARARRCSARWGATTVAHAKVVLPDRRGRRS